MASLSSLPPELIGFVIGHLDRLRDLSSLARADRRLYNIVDSALYKRIVVAGDAWPLAWAAHCGIAGTLRKVLDAGISPDYDFVDSLPIEDWRRVNATAKQAQAPSEDAHTLCNTEDTEPTTKGSPETDASDHAATVTTTQPSSNSNPDFWHDWDRDSDVSMEDSISLQSDALSIPADHAHGSVVEVPAGRVIVRSYNALHLAAQSGHNNIIEILLEYGASLTKSCIHICECAPLYGLLNAAEAPEPDPHTPWTALHIAICHSRPETAMLLLRRGASHLMEADDVDNSGQCATALHHAAAVGLSDLVRYLVDNKIQPDVDVRDGKTLTPFYHAYAERRWDSTVPLLLTLGAEINVDTKLFLPYATITPLGEACRLGHFDAVDRLLDLGANANHGFIATQTGGGLSPLHMCCMPSAMPAHRETSPKALFSKAATDEARMRTIHKLVSKGALINDRDCGGDTPLIAAAQYHNNPALQAVITAGANIHDRNAGERNALMQSVLGPRNPVGAIQRSPEVLARTIRVLISGGARLDETDGEENTLLHLIFKGTTTLHSTQNSTLRVLLAVPGANDLCRVKNRDGQTPLQVAFRARNLGACDILVRRGCLGKGLLKDDLVAMFADALTSPGDQDTIDYVLDLDLDGVLASDPTLLTNLAAKNRYTAMRAARALAQRGLS
ncbi:hypothetical protein OQA88_9536 [Cercophora sp. LCS_1]